MPYPNTEASECEREPFPWAVAAVLSLQTTGGIAQVVCKLCALSDLP